MIRVKGKHQCVHLKHTNSHVTTKNAIVQLGILKCICSHMPHQVTINGVFEKLTGWNIEAH